MSKVDEKLLEVKYLEYHTYVNPYLLDQQDAWDNLEEIKSCHLERYKIYEEIKVTTDPNRLRVYGDLLESLEYKLQRLWGFPKDRNYHRIWEAPKCSCPKMDNEYFYPGGLIISKNCPLHGG